MVGVATVGVCGLGLAALQMNKQRAQSQALPTMPSQPSDSYDDSLPSARHSLYVHPSSESNLKIFAGNGNPQLAQEVAVRLGTQLGRATVGKFSDGETQVQIHDNVRGKDVYIIQPTCYPANDNLMELILMITTLRRASAKRIVAIVPYFGYGRQLDRKNRTTIAGADVSLMLEAAGVDQVVSIDLHAGQIQGFFEAKTPVENLDTTRSALPYFLSKELIEPVVVSASGKGVARATRFRDALARHGTDASVALLYVHNKQGFVDADQQHHHLLEESQEIMEVVGDVDGKDCIIVDDMIDSGSRVTNAAATLHSHGARRIFALATHALFTGDAVDKINRSPLHEVVVFNTVPLQPSKWSPIVRELSAGGLIAAAVLRLHYQQSLLDLQQ